MDDRDISDALADAILKMDYPDLHRGDGVWRPAAPKRRVRVRLPQPMPEGLTVPPGVTWHSKNGRFWARLRLTQQLAIPIGGCGATQEELDELGARYREARRLWKAGATVEEIKALGRKEAAGWTATC